jgi:uncharacterized protein YndB with AHSA1/START domain
LSKTKFVYVTYISAKQQQIWDALIKGEFTRKYWGHENISDWKPGSVWEHQDPGNSNAARIVGKVVEFNPPRRMVLTWAFPADASNPAAHSRVTFELEPMDTMVRLTVTHDELVPDSDMHRGIMEGWPRVLSSLKSFLETGTPLPTWAKKAVTA